ncbi:MAG: T9SS type A sorting domain-containing protein [Bacteroidales bacterium]|nr:T9SS type A sorting domain-containing protein [Bacteroidales bacterium]
MKKLLLTLVVMMTAMMSFSQNYTHYLNSWYSDDLYETKEFYYDESYKLIADYWVDKVGEETSVRDSLEYDANGNVTKLSCHQLLNGEWIYANYVEYTYNELNQRLTRDNYNYFGGSFEHGGTYNYQYDENGNMIHHDMYLGTWGLFETADYTYDENDNCTLIVSYSEGFSGEFEPSNMVEYTYNADGFLVEEKSYYYYNGWVLSTHVVYTRDENNNITVEENLDQYGSALERHEYEYDMNILFDEVVPFVNPEGEMPNPERTVNARNKDKYWTLNDGGTLTYVCDYYYYYKEIEGTGVTENVADDVEIYPNPVNDVLTVEASGFRFVEIFDLAGRCVASREVNGIADIDMSQVAKGVYFVKMNDENGPVTRKVVVE